MRGINILIIVVVVFTVPFLSSKQHNESALTANHSKVQHLQ